MVVTKYCDGCHYRKVFTSQQSPYCDYLCMTGHRRPCPPGNGCTVRVLREVHRRKVRTEEEKAAFAQLQKEKRKAYDRERYKNLSEEEREKGRERMRKHYQEHKEERNAKHREYVKENRERLNEYRREYRRKKKEEQENGCSGK